MATETKAEPSLRNVHVNEWVAGVAGGFVGGILFGLMMRYVMPPPLLEIVIPAMYGIEGPALGAGWALHQFHAVVLGVVYVALVQIQPFRGPAQRLRGAIALGIGYGIVTTIFLAVLVMPLWLSVVGFPQAPPFPNIAIPGTIMSLIGHVVYAIPVAVSYALLANE